VICTVIQYRNCEIKEFVLKCVHEMCTWLLGVKEIFGNMLLRC
jgi:hypothetical protein